MNIIPTGQTLGATVTGIDLREPLRRADFAALLRALGQYGVLRIPGMRLGAMQLREFACRFGSPHSIPTRYVAADGVADVDVLSNIMQDGRYIGIPDGGQSWHTDMSYNPVVGYVNTLVAHEVPMRGGQPLGATEFVNTAAAWDDLPADLREGLEGKTSTHDFNQYWEIRRRQGSARSPLTADERAARPPSRHPVVMTHPVSGRRFLYVNPAYCATIEELPPDEGSALLQRLLEHALLPKYRYVHHWQRDDVLLWDHLWTWHNAIADYGPDEHRLMLRCQIKADRIFEPAFVRDALAAAAAS